MFTHTENLLLLTLGVAQGMVIALLVLPRTGLPDLLVIVVALLVGLVLAALEFAVLAKLRGK